MILTFLKSYNTYDWWSTTNLISFTLKESSTNQAVGHKSLPNTPGWDIKKGDYRVRDTKVKNLDYIYYRNLRLKMLKYLLYPGILFTIIFVFVILRMFVKV